MREEERREKREGGGKRVSVRANNIEKDFCL